MCRSVGPSDFEYLRVSGELKVLKVGGMEYWNGIVERWKEHVHDVITSCLTRPELPLEPSAGSMVYCIF